MEFTIIKNSESATGYQIEDKRYLGLIPGLCCGWQYEYETADGELKYSSVTWTEETPEEYAYRWTTPDGRSWLEDGLRVAARFSGRVVFRGYAESYYDFEERETFVKEVDEKVLLQYMGN